MQIELGESYPVTVIKLLNKGIIVQLTDKSQQFIHISKISTQFVADVAEFVSVGDELVATCVKGTGKPVELSLISDKRPSAPPPVYRSESSSSKSSKNIDDMIADSIAAYNDKVITARKGYLPKYGKGRSNLKSHT